MSYLREMYEAMPGLLADDAGDRGRALAQFERRTSRSLDTLEMALVVLAGAMLATFTLSVLIDVATRSAGASIPWIPELTLGAFVWGLFLGGAVAIRRRLHFRLTAAVEQLTGTRRKVRELINAVVVILVASWMVLAGGSYFMTATTIYMQPSGTPAAVVAAAIPVSGLLVITFTLESLLIGWTRGFDTADPPQPEAGPNDVDGQGGPSTSEIDTTALAGRQDPDHGGEPR